MSRMLEALRRLEAAELLVAPPAPPAVAEPAADEASRSAVNCPAALAARKSEEQIESAVGDKPTVSAHPAPPRGGIACDELPFEPVFSPMDSWEEDDRAYGNSGLVDYDDWDEAPLADSPVTPAAEPTLAETLAGEVLAKIERAKQLADEAGKEDLPNAATGGSPVAPEVSAEAGDPPAPRTGLCPLCLDDLVHLSDELFIAPAVVETEDDVVEDEIGDVQFAEAEEEDAEQTVDEAAMGSRAPFEWEDLFPEMALGRGEETAEQTTPEEEIASASRLTEPLAGPTHSPTHSPTQSPAHSPAHSPAQSPTGVASHILEELEAAPHVPADLPLDDAIEEDTVVEESLPPDAPSDVEETTSDVDESAALEPEHAEIDEVAAHESAEPPAEASIEPSPQYSALSTNAESEQREAQSENVPNVDVPVASGAERAALADLNDAVLAKQFAELGQRVLSDLGVTTHPSAALAGAEHQPHVTDVALRTALSLALAGRQVLLVDAALADKHLTSGLGLSAEFGLSETLKGRVPWQQAVRATATPGLCVLPAGRISPPTLGSSDKRLADLLKELSSQWELVLLDAGSCHDSAAAPVIKSARNVYLLVRLGETQTEAAAAAIATIEKTGAKLRGAVATNA